MTTSAHLSWRRGVTLLAATLIAGAMTFSMTGPVSADPSPVPSAPAATPGGAGTTAAPGTITWAVQPSTRNGPDRRSSFTYTNLVPGTVVNDYVGVSNFSQSPVTFDVYATDGFNTTSGSLSLLAANEKPKDVGSWVALAKKTITINPGERINEPFTLTVPFNASPGDHVGGIIASVSQQASNGANVLVDQRLAVPIYLRVSGELKSGVAVESISTTYRGTFNPFAGGDAEVAFTVHNTGNTRLDLTAGVVVKGLFGLSLGRVQTPVVKDLLPGATYRVTQRVSGVFPLGPLTAHVEAVPAPPAGLPATANPPVPTSGEAGLWATPWSQLALLVLLVVLGFGIMWYLRRGRERTQRKVAKAVAKARRETVEQLTGKSGPAAASGK